MESGGGGSRWRMADAAKRPWCCSPWQIGAGNWMADFANGRAASTGGDRAGAVRTRFEPDELGLSIGLDGKCATAILGVAFGVADVEDFLQGDRGFPGRAQLIHPIGHLLGVVEIDVALVELLACLDNIQADLHGARHWSSAHTIVRCRPKSNIRPTAAFNHIRKRLGNTVIGILTRGDFPCGCTREASERL